MAVKLSPVFNDAQLDSSGNPYVGAQLFTYASGSTTPQTTYQDSAGLTQHTNPIVLNARGEPPAPIWLTEGSAYKLYLTTPTDTSPPVTSVRVIDNVRGVNDTTVSSDQWAAGPAPTYVSGTSFTLVGDQTSTFHVGRRLKTTNTSGTVYSTISASAFGALTTVTVVNDSTVLDSGLSAVSYGLLSATNPSIPLITDAFPILSGSADKTKKLRLEIDGLTTATTRVLTVQDSDDVIVGRNTTDTLTNKSLTSPTMTGTPIAPTAAPGTNTTQVATTAFTAAAVTAASAGSSLVLIATASASASAVIDFASGITSTYDEYLVTLTDIIPATDNTQLLLRFSQDGGSTFKAGATDYSWAQNTVDNAAIATPSGTTAATAIQVGLSLSNNTTRSYCGEVRFWNPAGTAKNKHCRFKYSSVPSAGAYNFAEGGGVFLLNSSAINAIRFLESAGNITSGNFALYGVKKT